MVQALRLHVLLSDERENWHIPICHVNNVQVLVILNSFVEQIPYNQSKWWHVILMLYVAFKYSSWQLHCFRFCIALRWDCFWHTPWTPLVHITCILCQPFTRRTLHHLFKYMWCWTWFWSRFWVITLRAALKEKSREVACCRVSDTKVPLGNVQFPVTGRTSYVICTVFSIPKRMTVIVLLMHLYQRKSCISSNCSRTQQNETRQEYNQGIHHDVFLSVNVQRFNTFQWNKTKQNKTIFYILSVVRKTRLV